MVTHNFPEAFQAGRIVFSDGSNELDAAALATRISSLRAALQARRAPHAPVALLADNSPEWLAADLATQQLGLTLVPLPLSSRRPNGPTCCRKVAPVLCWRLPARH